MCWQFPAPNQAFVDILGRHIVDVKYVEGTSLSDDRIRCLCGMGSPIIESTHVFICWSSPIGCSSSDCHSPASGLAHQITAQQLGTNQFPALHAVCFSQLITCYGVRLFPRDSTGQRTSVENPYSKAFHPLVSSQAARYRLKTLKVLLQFELRSSSPGMDSFLLSKYEKCATTN
ncbi:hypothetical protein BCR34DRAFT_562838 [Clohesyomyces aquaticus]|uniref:Uncharacterized protein n=1 Tax=Clohesyomyces aquaticus TaxID=1231657 RepID=A0A1Y1ZRS5_9PLEO|nr:hypothetical protein BCR34DRAFT_562838 [Clohesyomyces aquaticus]